MFKKIEDDEQLKKFYRDGTFLDETTGSLSALSDRVKCPDCARLEVMLQLALIAAKKRLITVTNEEHDEIFNKIEAYFTGKYPETRRGT